MTAIKFLVRDNRLLHVAEQSITPGMAESDKTPYCRNGGINLRAWELSDLDPMDVQPSDVCGACRQRMRANNVVIGLLPDGV